MTGAQRNRAFPDFGRAAFRVAACRILKTETRCDLTTVTTSSTHQGRYRASCYSTHRLSRVYQRPGASQCIAARPKTTKTKQYFRPNRSARQLNCQKSEPQRRRRISINIATLNSTPVAKAMDLNLYDKTDNRCSNREHQDNCRWT